MRGTGVLYEATGRHRLFPKLPFGGSVGSRREDSEGWRAGEERCWGPVGRLERGPAREQAVSGAPSPSRDSQPMAATDMHACGLVERCRWCASGRVPTVRVPVSPSPADDSRYARRTLDKGPPKVPSRPLPSSESSLSVHVAPQDLIRGKLGTHDSVRQHLDDAPTIRTLYQSVDGVDFPHGHYRVPVSVSVSFARNPEHSPNLLKHHLT